MKKIKSLILALAMLSGFNAYSAPGSCVELTRQCVDSTPSKVIDGEVVNVSDFGGCWEYSSTYECVDNVGANFCAPFQDASSGCAQYSTVCLDANCLTSTKIYSCAAPFAALPNGSVLLGDVFTITKEYIDDSLCALNNVVANSPLACRQVDETCLGDPEVRTINGLEVSRSCWDYSRTYACPAPSSNTCPDKLAQGCQPEGEPVCQDDVLTGACHNTRQDLICPVASVKPGQGNCESVTCIGSTCFSEEHPQDNNLADAVGAGEFSQQLANYMKDGRVFRGEIDSCRTGKFYGEGTNCCTDGDAKVSSNQSFGEQIGMQLVSSVGTLLVKAAWNGMSAYAIDYMMGTSMAWLPEAAIAAYQSMVATYQAAVTALSAAYEAASATVLAAGVSSGLVSAGSGAAVTSTAVGAAAGGSGAAAGGAAAAGGGAMLVPGLSYAATGTTASFVGASVSTPIGSAFGQTLYFNPATLAIAVVIYIIVSLLTCDAPDLMVSSKVQTGFCVYIKNYCTDEDWFGGCIGEERNQYCCFNSKIAKAIMVAVNNQQGRFGKYFRCDGATVEDINKLDWSKVDMSEFGEQVMAQVKVPDATSDTLTLSESMNNKGFGELYKSTAGPNGR